MSTVDIPEKQGAGGSPAAGEAPSFRAPGVETEPAPGGLLPGILRFFVVPLLLVGASVAVFAGLGAIVGQAPPTAGDLVLGISAGGKNSRWQAAQELSNLVYRKEVDLGKDERLVRALVDAFQKARAEGDDPRVIQLLATLLGRSPAPLTGPALLQGLDDGNPDVRIYVAAALAEQGQEAALPSLRARTEDLDAGVRTMAVYAVAVVADRAGAVAAACSGDALVKALQDSSMDVRWNAALGLARLGRAEGADLVWDLLHRDFVRANLQRGDGAGAAGLLGQQGSDPSTPDQVEERVVLNALSAAWRLKDRSMIEGARALAAGDPSAPVRDWAMRLQALLEEEARAKAPVAARAWTKAR